MSLLVFKSQKCKPLDKAVLPLQASFGSWMLAPLNRVLRRDVWSGILTQTAIDHNSTRQLFDVSASADAHQSISHHDTTVLHRTHTHVGIFANRIGESSALLCQSTALDWQMRLLLKKINAVRQLQTPTNTVTRLLGQNPSTLSSTTLIFLLNSDY